MTKSILWKSYRKFLTLNNVLFGVRTIALCLGRGHLVTLTGNIPWESSWSRMWQWRHQSQICQGETDLLVVTKVVNWSPDNFVHCGTFVRQFCSFVHIFDNFACFCTYFSAIFVLIFQAQTDAHLDTLPAQWNSLLESLRYTRFYTIILVGIRKFHLKSGTNNDPHPPLRDKVPLFLVLFFDGSP